MGHKVSVFIPYMYGCYLYGYVKYNDFVYPHFLQCSAVNLLVHRNKSVTPLLNGPNTVTCSHHVRWFDFGSAFGRPSRSPFRCKHPPVRLFACPISLGQCPKSVHRCIVYYAPKYGCCQMDILTFSRHPYPHPVLSARPQPRVCVCMCGDGCALWESVANGSADDGSNGTSATHVTHVRPKRTSRRFAPTSGANTGVCVFMFVVRALACVFVCETCVGRVSNTYERAANAGWCMWVVLCGGCLCATVKRCMQTLRAHRWH